MEKVFLNEIGIKESCRVIGILPDSSVKKRLMDMGIVKGVTVRVEGKASFGDPIEILVRGYKLTLRKNEAKAVEVEKV